jgi:hypothetical protein
MTLSVIKESNTECPNDKERFCSKSSIDRSAKLGATLVHLVKVQMQQHISQQIIFGNTVIITDNSKTSDDT